jgi:RNA polymerase primary sigma factor/RNA polymerase sigma factor
LTVVKEQRQFRQLRRVRRLARTFAEGSAVNPFPRRFQRKTTKREQATAIRNRIVESNLRLVVSIAKRFVGQGDELDDLVSEGVLTLIRCVETFNPDQGTRFSTYATRALINGFGKRSRRRQSRRVGDLSGDLLSQIAEPRDRRRPLAALVHQEEIRHLRHQLRRLPIREQQLVAARYGLTGEGRPLTFREIGVRHGLSKERVRVITAEALDRLKGAFSDGS